MKDFDVVLYAQTRLADYYKVGAAKLVTVTARNASGKYVCHTCVVNKCEHTAAVEAFEQEHGTPEQQARATQHAQAATPDTLDLSEVEL